MDDLEKDNDPSEKIDMKENENEDVVFEAEDNESGPAYGTNKLKRLEEKLKVSDAEKAEYLLNWQKERADFQNFKREEDSRLNRAKAIGFQKGLAGVISILDSFDMAFSNKEAWAKADEVWRVGVEYIHQQGLQFLADNDVEIIDPIAGTKIDHNIHEAVKTADTEDENLDDTVANVIQKGYRTKEYTIRPARVVANKLTK